MFETTPLQTKRRRATHNKDLEEAVVVYFKQQRSLNVPISGPILQAKTDQLTKRFKLENYKCSAF